MLHGGALRSTDTWIQLYRMKETNTVTLLRVDCPAKRLRVGSRAARRGFPGRRS